MATQPIDVDAIIREEIARLHSEKESTTQEPETRQGITVKIGDQPYSFADEAQLSNFLTQALAQQAQSTQAAQTAADAAKAAAEAATARKAETPAQPGKAEASRFVDLIAEDPAKAIDYALASQFGVDNPTAVLKGALMRVLQHEQVLNQMRTEQEARAWVEDHRDEYAASKENGQKMMEILKELELPLSYQTLEAAYAYGKSKGVFGETKRTPEPALIPPRPMAPPSIGARTTAPENPDILAQAENMSIEQLEGLIRKFQS